jgi:hypothetical protein
VVPTTCENTTLVCLRVLVESSRVLVLRYLAGAVGEGLTYGHREGLECYVDASFAPDGKWSYPDVQYGVGCVSVRCPGGLGQ